MKYFMAVVLKCSILEILAYKFKQDTSSSGFWSHFEIVQELANLDENVDYKHLWLPPSVQPFL